MPKQTFFNLSGRKRTRLMDALKAEFAAHPYSRASVERVTVAAGVSKGSFYQYFEDKQDAYTYLVTELMSSRIDVAGAPVPQESFRDVLLAQIGASGDFQARDPLGWAVLSRSYAEDASVALASRAPLAGEVRTWAVAAITAGQAEGSLRDDVDPRTAAWLVERALMGLPEHLMSRFPIDVVAAASQGSAMNRPEIAQVAREVVDMLVAALAPRRP